MTVVIGEVEDHRAWARKQDWQKLIGSTCAGSQGFAEKLNQVRRVRTRMSMSEKLIQPKVLAHTFVGSGEFEICREVEIQVWVNVATLSPDLLAGNSGRVSVLLSWGEFPFQKLFTPEAFWLIGWGPPTLSRVIVCLT